MSDDTLHTLTKISEESQDIGDDSLIIMKKTGRAQTATNLAHRAAVFFLMQGLEIIVALVKEQKWAYNNFRNGRNSFNGWEAVL